MSRCGSALNTVPARSRAPWKAASVWARLSLTSLSEAPNSRSNGAIAASSKRVAPAAVSMIWLATAAGARSALSRQFAIVGGALFSISVSALRASSMCLRAMRTGFCRNLRAIVRMLNDSSFSASERSSPLAQMRLTCSKCSRALSKPARASARRCFCSSSEAGPLNMPPVVPKMRSPTDPPVLKGASSSGATGDSSFSGGRRGGNGASAGGSNRPAMTLSIGSTPTLLPGAAPAAMAPAWSGTVAGVPTAALTSVPSGWRSVTATGGEPAAIMLSMSALL